jgi:hypothetical protein
VSIGQIFGAVESLTIKSTKKFSNFCHILDGFHRNGRQKENVALNWSPIENDGFSRDVSPKLSIYTV